MLQRILISITFVHARELWVKIAGDLTIGSYTAFAQYVTLYEDLLPCCHVASVEQGGILQEDVGGEKLSLLNGWFSLNDTFLTFQHRT